MKTIVYGLLNPVSFRSAPENVRLSLPEEGEPGGPDLPEDLTQIQKQVDRINQNHEPMQAIPEHETLEVPETPPMNLQNPNVTPPNKVTSNRRDSSANESWGQPDEEPEVPSRQETNHDPNNQAEVFLTCTEEQDCVLTNSDDCHLAWRCEFELAVPEQYQENHPSPEETWILLATSAKKQRTEVRLSELTPSEREEFAAAKQTEVNNWINIEARSIMLPDQIPDDQVLRRRWILTWKPLDVADGGVDNQSTKQHKAKARIVVLGYLDPHLDEIPRSNPWQIITHGNPSNHCFSWLESSKLWH